MDNQVKYYRWSEVRNAAVGNWEYIFRNLLPQVGEAIDKLGRKVTCPFHGGKNDFRFKKEEFLEKGSAFCTCDSFPDGFILLQKGLGLSGPSGKEHVRDRVGELLQLTPRIVKDRNFTNPKSTTSKDRYSNASGASESSEVSDDHDISCCNETLQADDSLLDFPFPPENTDVIPFELADLPLAQLSSPRDDGDATPTANRRPSQPPEERPVAKALKASPKTKTDEIERCKVLPSHPESVVEKVPERVITTSGSNPASHIGFTIKTQDEIDAIRREREQTEQQEEAKAQQKMLDILQHPDTVPIFHESARTVLRYFDRRGVSYRDRHLFKDMFFNPNVWYARDDEEIEKLIEKEQALPEEKRTKNTAGFYCPALLSVIRTPSGEIANIHRTFLTARSGQKATVKMPKKTMSKGIYSISGGAIRMGEPFHGILGVAEGIESALSGYKAFGIPTWPLVCANGIETFEPPCPLSLVLIFADKDQSQTGQKVAAKLQLRLKELGIPSLILLPPLPIPKKTKKTENGVKGGTVDWNDALIQQGLHAFPNKHMLLKPYLDLIQQQDQRQSA